MNWIWGIFSFVAGIAGRWVAYGLTYFAGKRAAKEAARKQALELNRKYAQDALSDLDRDQLVKRLRDGEF